MSISSRRQPRLRVRRRRSRRAGPVRPARRRRPRRPAWTGWSYAARNAAAGVSPPTQGPQPDQPRCDLSERVAQYAQDRPDRDDGIAGPTTAARAAASAASTSGEGRGGVSVGDAPGVHEARLRGGCECHLVHRAFGSMTDHELLEVAPEPALRTCVRHCPRRTSAARVRARDCLVQFASAPRWGAAPRPPCACVEAPCEVAVAEVDTRRRRVRAARP